MSQQVQEFNHFRLATIKDLKYLAPRLRFEDKREILSTAGMFPYTALYYSYLKSAIVFTIVNDKKEPVGIFGVAVSSLSCKAFPLVSGGHTHFFLRF